MSGNPVFAQDDGLSASAIQSQTETSQNNKTIVTETSTVWSPRGPLGNDNALAIGLGAGGLVLLFGMVAYRRRIKVAAPYMLAGGVVALMLANPEKLTEDFEQNPTDIVVLVDQSASNKIADRETMTTEIRERLLSQINGLPNFNIRIVNVEDNFNSSENDGTEIFNALSEIDGLNASHVGGIIIVTDGQNHDTPEVSPLGENVPVHVMLTGQDNEIDRVASLIASPTFGLVGEEQTIRFKIDDKGLEGQPPRSVRVEIFGENQPVKIVDAVVGETVETTIVVPNSGPNIFTVSAESLDGELTDENNRIIVKVDGIREDLNVLMISGAINNGVSDLRSFYKSDPDSNLIHFMSMRIQRDFDSTPREELALTPVPLHEVFSKSLGKFDLIVLDHFEDFNIIPKKYLDGMAGYVENGGSLLVVAGPEFERQRSLYNTPLGRILPAVPQRTTTELQQNSAVPTERFVPQVTDLGDKHPVVRGLNGAGSGEISPSWGNWVNHIESDVLSGHTLMDTPSGSPLLILDEVEDGRVAVLLSDSFPFWDGPSSQLLQRTSHWLMRTPELEPEALRVTKTNDGALIIQRQTLSDEPPAAATIHGPNGKTDTVEFTNQRLPGLWEAEYSYGDDGVYRVTQDEMASFINVGLDQTIELANVITTKEILQPIATQTGGAIMNAVDQEGNIWIPDLRQLETNDTVKQVSGEDWIGLIDRDAKTAMGYERTPRIPGWAGGLFIVGCLLWGWSRDNDHTKIKNLLGKKNRDNAEKPPAQDNSPKPE